MNSTTEKYPLALSLQRAITEQGRSVRGLAIDAGLLPDTVRNILRGLSRKPNQDSLEALSRVLGIEVPILLGEAAWPSQPDFQPPVPAKQNRKRASSRTGSLTVLEYQLQPGAPAEIASHSPVGTWSIPVDLLESRGLRDAQLSIVRAPSGLDEITAGDRLLVDTADNARLPSPPGLMVVHDGIAHLLARVQVTASKPGQPARVRVQTSTSNTTSQVDSVDICARVLGKWTWM